MCGTPRALLPLPYWGRCRGLPSRRRRQNVGNSLPSPGSRSPPSTAVCCRRNPAARRIPPGNPVKPGCRPARPRRSSRRTWRRNCWRRPRWSNSRGRHSLRTGHNPSRSRRGSPGASRNRNHDWRRAGRRRSHRRDARPRCSRRSGPGARAAGRAPWRRRPRTGVARLPQQEFLGSVSGGIPLMRHSAPLPSNRPFQKRSAKAARALCSDVRICGATAPIGCACTLGIAASDGLRVSGSRTAGGSTTFLIISLISRSTVSW